MFSTLKVLYMKIPFDEKTFKKFLRVAGFPLPKGVRVGWVTDAKGKVKDFWVEVD